MHGLATWATPVVLRDIFLQHLQKQHRNHNSHVSKSHESHETTQKHDYKKSPKDQIPQLYTGWWFEPEKYEFVSCSPYSQYMERHNWLVVEPSL